MGTRRGSVTEEKPETDPVELFLHVDKKVDDTKGQLGVIREVNIELKKMLERLEQRVDHGIARTGQENKTTLSEHSIKLNDLNHHVANLSEDVRGTREALGLAIKEVGDRTNLIYKSIVGIFFVVLVGGFVGFVFRELPSWFR